jgi:hypothetical protein
MTPAQQSKERRLRNEIGQLTHKMHSLMEQRAQMQADLVQQRKDMQSAILACQSGNIREALDILQSALDYRERTRVKRGGASRCATWLND